MGEKKKRKNMCEGKKERDWAREQTIKDLFQSQSPESLHSENTGVQVVSGKHENTADFLQMNL